MNKQFFLYTLLLIFSFSFCETHSQSYHDQTEYNATVESLDDEEIDVDEETPKQPTFSKSWGKVLSFDWASLSKDDVYNIGVSIAAIGTTYYICRYFLTRDKNAQPFLHDPHIRPRPNNPRKQTDFEIQKELKDLARQRENLENLRQQMKNDEVYQAKKYAYKIPELTKQMEEFRKALDENKYAHLAEKEKCEQL